MESQWTGTVEDAFFDGEKFDANRILLRAEKEASGRASKSAYYIISADIARGQCQSIACIFKVTPQPQGPSIKSLVNIIDLGSDDHFENQSIMLKKLYYKYKAKRLVIDANGLGIGLIDYMVKPHILPDGDILPDFGVYNDDKNRYKQFRTKDCELDAIYQIKANAAINTEAHTIVQSNLEHGKIKFLIDDIQAKNKLLGTKVGQEMSPEKRAAYLQPYVLTSILKEEMMNLREESEGINIILKQANRRIGKDKFSALEYALYYIQEEEDSKKKRKRFVASDWVFKN